MIPLKPMSISRLAFALCVLAAFSACTHLYPFHRAKPAPTAAAQAAPSTPVVRSRTTPAGLVLEIKETPDPVRLGETRQLQVTLTLRNNGKRAANFKFPSGQEIEILLRDPETGKAITSWSTDRTFDAQPRFVVLNSKERLEFSEPIATRDLKAGKTYSLEAYFVGYDGQLRVSRPVIPQP